MIAGKHCDDYIDDESQPECLRKYLAWARGPGHGMTQTKPHPQLYANHEGVRVRVVMASRLGDVGITTILANEYGYQRRVNVDSLTDFGDTP